MIMTKNVAAIFGSSISQGNTGKLLKEAVRGAEDAGCCVEVIDVPKLNISGCSQIYGCLSEKQCFLDDQMQKYFEMIKKCDGIITASPVMTYGIPGRLKCFLDRFQVFYMAKYIRKQPFVSKEAAKRRKMLFISIAGMNTDDVFDGSILTMKAFCDIIDCRYSDELLQNDMDRILNIDRLPDVLKAAYDKGYALGSSI